MSQSMISKLVPGMSNSDQPPPPFEFVSKGMTVLWYPDGNLAAEPQAAIVRRVNGRTLDLSIVVDEVDRMIHRDGVHHCGDHKVSQPTRIDSGGWMHTEFTVRLYARIRNLAEWPKPEQAKPE